MSPLIALMVLGCFVWGMIECRQRDRIHQLPKGCLVSRAPAARESRSTTFNPRAWRDAPVPVAIDRLAAYTPKYVPVKRKS